MKLATIVDGKVVIHPELLMLPPFKNLWEGTEDKNHVNDVITYIVLNNKWDSPYVITNFDEEDRSKKLKDKIFGDSNYKFTTEETLCENEYKTLLDTETMKMLKNMRKKLGSFSRYYGDSLDEELDEKKIKEYLAGFGKVKDAFVTVDFLENAIKKEELSTSKIKGDAKVNPYELVR